MFNGLKLLSIYPAPVFHTIIGQWLAFSVAFSPADPTLVATGGDIGPKLYDIRQNSLR